MLARISKTIANSLYRSSHSKEYMLLCTMKFSSQKDINRLGETSKIADRVISMIRSPFEVSELQKEVWIDESPEQQIKRVKSYALAERIKDALVKLKTHEQSRNDILQLFTTGVEPSAQIFHQARIRSARMDWKLVYCPNSIISRQFFSIMGPKIEGQICQNEDRLILTGYKGISKTLSISLLWHLVGFIDEYRFSRQEVQQNAKIKFNHPKIVYWSIRQDDTQKDVWQSLMQQLPEMKSSFTLEQIINKEVKVKKFYLQNYGTQVNLIVDQINFLANQYTKLNSKKEKFINVQQNPDCQEQESTENWSHEEQKQLIKIQFLMKLVKKISSKFNRTFYLSPKNIEPEFIVKCDLATNGMHTTAPVFQVQYAKQLYQDLSLIDLCHFFIFEFNQKVFKKKQFQVSKEELMKAREMCVEQLKKKLQNKQYFFITFLDIFSEIKSFSLNETPLRQVIDMKNYLLDKFMDLIERATADVRQQFYEHFLKNDEFNSIRKITALKLSEQIFKLTKAENNKQPKQNKIKSLQSNQVASITFGKHYDNDSFSSPPEKVYTIHLSKLNLNKTKARDVLSPTFFSFDNKNQVNLRLPAKLVYEFLEPKIQENLHFYSQNVNQLISPSMTTAELASTIEWLFVLALKRGDTSFIMQYKAIQAGSPSNFTKRYDTIQKGSYGFTPLNKKGPHSLLQLVRNSLQKMLDNSQEFAVLEPVSGKLSQIDLYDGQPHQIDEARKGTELILANLRSLGPNRKIIQLDLIDITLQDSQTLIENKMKAFLKIFLSLKDKEANSIELKLTSSNITIAVETNYFIFCRKNSQQSLLQKLRKAPIIKDEFEFVGSGDVNSFGVSLKNSKNSLLTQVGFISMEDDIQFIQDQQEKDVLNFKQAINVLKKRRQRKNKTTEQQ